MFDVPGIRREILHCVLVVGLGENCVRLPCNDFPDIVVTDEGDRDIVV